MKKEKKIAEKKSKIDLENGENQKKNGPKMEKNA